MTSDFGVTAGHVEYSNRRFGFDTRHMVMIEVYRHTETLEQFDYQPICPLVMHSLFLRDAIPQEHKDDLDMSKDYLYRASLLVVCGSTVDETVKNDIAIAYRLHKTATTLDGILTVKGQGRNRCPRE